MKKKRGIGGRVGRFRTLDFERLTGKPIAGLAALFVLTLTAFAWSQGISNEDCLSCHSDADLSKTGPSGQKVPLFVDLKKYESSVHGGFGCTDCHSDITEIPHPEKLKPVDCSSCHAETVEKYGRGVHATARAKGNLQSPTCVSCHTPHAIRPASDPASPTARRNIPDLCGKCHGDLKFVAEQTGILSAQPFFNYKESVHGRAREKGDEKAAVCSDCHKSHDLLPPSDPQSTIFKANVPATCGQCHGKVAEEYTASIHGQALKAGLSRSPACTDCHGIHTIKTVIDPASPVAAQALARTTCIQCHESEGLSKEYGLPAKRISTYLDSYHGLASRFGSNVVANCASCHGIHNIYPSSDSRSLIHPANLATTCGSCHPGASENFARGKIHVLSSTHDGDTGAKVVGWVTAIYIVLIVVVIGGMLLHNAADWLRSVWGSWRTTGPHFYLKFTVWQRIQHAGLFVSFFGLAFTGFALTYPEQFSWLFGEDEELRSLLHRIFAVLFLADGALHLGHVLFSKSGRRFIFALMPKKADLAQLVGNLKYYLGRAPLPAPEPAYGYVEKSEYWALVWGGIIMALTGFVLWFQDFFLRFLPKWSTDVATAIHFYEAVLATLAIFVWHFYAVIFKPGVYPMNWAWMTGRAHRPEGEKAASVEAEKQPG
ncbi:MAG TPA: cytochrome c3 family protein [Verrucomicrobiae bacterium]|nr:cytochrome c3 family protein [Verrucomicrobiae bacterium]